MNITQMHERLRLELLRRIQRGTLSVSLLARQTGFGQSHISNFLRCRRQLSIEAIDRILVAQHMTVDDLLPNVPERAAKTDAIAGVPLVSFATAMNDIVIRPPAIQNLIFVPAAVLQTSPMRVLASRANWQRFVAIAPSATEAKAMEPVIQPDGIALLDRHYTSLVAYRPNRHNIYAVRHDGRMKLRYLDFQMSRLILRPNNLDFPLDLLSLAPGESLADLIVGRVAMLFNEV